MSNWFSSGLKDLTEKVAAATENIQKSLPIDVETLQKLTLNTPDMINERTRFQEEYKHKLAVKDSLAHMYPWETRDPERDILVEECKEAILALSLDKETFFGPYQMPMLNVNTEDDDDEEEKTEEELLEEQDPDNVTAAASSQGKEVKNKEPSLESREKLAKLEPLPPLLANFDLIAHVGLIQKMLKVDPTLVERQSTLSGGGDREKVFWHNYFFHCAFTRYEAGLSIDEIWSDQRPTTTTTTADNANATESGLDHTIVADGEEVVTFDTTISKTAAVSMIATAAAAETALHHESEGGDEIFSNQAESPTTNEYELVDMDGMKGNDDDNFEDDDAFGGELDELEAEIAKELED